MEAKFIPFTAQTRMSGVDLGANRQIRKGSVDAIEAYVRKAGGFFPEDLKSSIESILMHYNALLLNEMLNHVLIANVSLRSS